MKPFIKLSLPAIALLSLSACTNLNLQAATPTPIPRGPEIRAVFVGNTPCSAGARPLPQIPADGDCEQMKWNLVLYQDPQTGDPTTYRLKSAYGLSRQGTNDLLGGGTPISMEGKWTVTTGTKEDPDALVYQLETEDPQAKVSFLKIDEDMIHVLNGEKEMLVGNGAWSYTLNRMEDQRPDPAEERTAALPNPPTRPPQPPMPAGSSVFAVFDGRTPCDEVALEFTGTAPHPGCVKIKWRLTLSQDEATGAPGRYLFMSTSDYRQGSWEIVRGLDGDPEAVIYQLQPEGSQQSFSFLKVDDNHLFLMDSDMDLLVGNELFSYTLSRTDPGTR